jgi:hypothetical protein
MRNRFSMVIALGVLLASILACELPEGVRQKSPGSGLDGIYISPRSSEDRYYSATITYFWRMGDSNFLISCNYPNPDGVYISEVIPLQHEKTSVEISFVVNTPGTYNFSCTDIGSTRDKGTASMVEVFTRLETPTATETIPAQPPDQTGGSSSACLWQVAGTWNVTQANGFHPTFVITQTGTTLGGTATLPPNEVTLGGYACESGTGAGSVDVNIFTYIVTCPPTADGQVISGTYTGVITEGRIEEQNGAWSATGPSQCVSP